MKVDSRWATCLASALILGTAAATAIAGATASQEVYFNKNSVYGDLGYVRNTPDTVQNIGCVIFGTPAGALCYATNSAGVGKACTTTDPVLLAVIGSLHGDSYLVFRVNPVDGTCSSVNVYNDSRYAPK
jgi:hypothetical protein